VPGFNYFANALDRFLERDPKDNNLSPDEIQVLESLKIYKTLSGVRNSSPEEKEGVLTFIGGSTKMGEARLNELREKVKRLLLLRPV